MQLLPGVQELERALVAQSFLYPASVVEDLNIFEDGLAGRFAGRIESPEHDFFLEDGEEAFAPRIVSRSADVGEALLPTVFRYLCHHVKRTFHVMSSLRKWELVQDTFLQ